MDKGKKVTNFKWGKNHSRFFISFLAEEARAGWKVDKCFKNVSMVAAAKAVNQNFPNLNVSKSNCVNHYRTLKTRWCLIRTLKNLRGVSWNEDSKMVVMGDEQYQTYIEAHPNVDPYINKTIEQYEELSLICGEDYADGSLARSMVDGTGYPMMQNNSIGIGRSQGGFQDMDTSNASPNQGITGSTTAMKKSAGKRTRNMVTEEGFKQLAEGLGEVAKALRSMPDLEWSKTLYGAIMEMKEFPTSILDRAYDYLIDRKHEALKFITRRLESRASWLDKFSLGEL